MLVVSSLVAFGFMTFLFRTENLPSTKLVAFVIGILAATWLYYFVAIFPNQSQIYSNRWPAGTVNLWFMAVALLISSAVAFARHFNARNSVSTKLVIGCGIGVIVGLTASYIWPTSFRATLVTVILFVTMVVAAFEMFLRRMLSAKDNSHIRGAKLVSKDDYLKMLREEEERSSQKYE
jgi:uncharacterized membrane protein YfcA